MDSVTRDRPEIEPAIPQSRLSISDFSELAYRLIEQLIDIEGVGLPPEGLAHELVTTPTAMEPLLGAIVEARDTLKAKQYSDAEDDLRVELVGIVCICATEPLFHVVVVKKRHEEPSCFAVAGQDIPLDFLAATVDLDDLGRRSKSLGNRR